MTQAVTLRTVPAAAGWHWIVRGWQLLKANPIHIHMAFFFFLGSLGVMSMVPFIGSVLAAMFMPALYLGVMATIGQAERTSSVQPTRLLDALGSPFKKDATGQRTVFKRLASLGLVYTLVVFVALTAVNWFNGDDFFKTLLLNEKPSLDAATRERLSFGLLGILLIYAPISMAFWFTQQLVGWHGQTIGKSVFFSWLGCWRNKSAFAVYGVAWALIFLAMSLAVVSVSSLLNSPTMAGILITPLTLFLMVWVFCSFYASYEGLVHVIDAEDSLQTTPQQ
jgi:hypothetical protein